ncbi:MAG: hypothetical protein HY445_01625 [Candidatus Niyogibacteria bacterium]|nr:hypothetical protein [Candidatus Niyogibacteria bacterium]
MKVVMVARDAAPSKAFQMLGEELLKRRHFFHLFVGSGSPLTVSNDDIRQVVSKMDIVIVGMSSSKELAEPEMAAAEAAMNAGVPLVAYGDLFGTVNRQFFSELWQKTGKAPHMLFVLDDYEKQDAESKYPSSTKVIVTGNPAIEKAYFPEWTRKEAREKMGITDDDFVVIVPGGKDFRINAQLFQTATVAMFEMWREEKGRAIKVFLATHPGDENVQNGKRPDEYFGLENLGVSPRFTVKVFTKANSDPPTPKIVIGADGMIASMFTTGIDAAIQRVPVVDVITPYALERFGDISGGRTKWGPGELGASHAVYAYDYSQLKVLVRAVEYYFFGAGRNEMLAAQKKAYPDISKPVVIKKMADALESIIEC